MSLKKSNQRTCLRCSEQSLCLLHEGSDINNQTNQNDNSLFIPSIDITNQNSDDTPNNNATAFLTPTNIHMNANANTNAKKLQRELDKLQNNNLGKQFEITNTTKRRSTNQPIIIEDDSPEIKRKSQKNKTNSKQKKKKSRSANNNNNQNNNTNIDPNQETMLWNPNENQSIKIIQQNRRGETIKIEDIPKMQEEYKDNNIAIAMYTETRLTSTIAKQITMNNHHHIYSVLTDKEREDAYINKKCKKELKILKSQSNGFLNTEAAELKINQTIMKFKNNPEKYKQHGISVFINNLIYPLAEIIEITNNNNNKEKLLSPNHIVIKLQDTSKQTIILIAIYGPPNSTKDNNDFYKLKIAPIVEKYQNDPIIMLGDFNATSNTIKDIKTSSKPTKKIELQNIMLENKLIDLRRKLHPDSTEYTFKAKRQNNSIYEANLDYFIANEAWYEKYFESIINLTTKSQTNKDHLMLILEIKKHTKQIKTAKRKIYKRDLTDEQINHTINQLKQILTNGQDKEDQFRNTNFIINDLIKTLEINNTNQPKQQNLGTDYRRTKTIANATIKIMKIIIANKNLVSYQNSKHTSKPARNDQSATARIARLNFRIHQTDPSKYVNPKSNQADWLNDLKQMLKQLRATKKSYLRKAKKNLIKKRIQNIIESYHTAPRKFFKKLRQLFSTPNHQITSLTKKEEEENIITTDPAEIKNIIHQFYADLYDTKREENEEFTQQFLEPKTISLESEMLAIRNITIEETLESITNLASNKAAGPNNAAAEIYQTIILSNPDNDHLNNPLLNIIHNRIAHIWEEGRMMPINWRESITSLIYKNGDKNDIGNYRPITLTDVIYKAYAYILNNRLVEFIESNNLLNTAQCGFRPERGTAQKLIAIKSALQYANENQEEIHIISIDIKKAFDSVEYWLIRQATSNEYFKLPKKLQDAIMDTMDGSQIKIRTIYGETDSINIKRGVRQGDPLSAMIFNIAINSLLDKLEKNAMNHNPNNHQKMFGPHAFADDIEIVAKSKAEIEDAWAIVTEFMNLTGLELNVSKTIYIANDKARTNNNLANIQYKNQPIQATDKNKPFKILGVWFTTELDWKYQKNISRGRFFGELKTIMKRKVTDLQLIEIINCMLMSALSYHMCVTSYTNEEIADIKKGLNTLILKKLKIQEKTGWEDYFTLKREEYGGLGLLDLQDLYDAAQVNTTFLSLYGPDTPAKRIIENEIKTRNIHESHITFSNKIILQDTINVLDKRNISLHSSSLLITNNVIYKNAMKKKQFKNNLNSILQDNLDTNVVVNMLLTEDHKAKSLQEIKPFTKPETTDASIKRIIQSLNDTSKSLAKTQRTTPLQCSTSYSQRTGHFETFDDKIWEISFTDGSANLKGNKASWAIYTPTDKDYISISDLKNKYIKLSQLRTQVHHARVEGPQTNQRAELSAITILLQLKVNTTELNQLIITDSEYAINSIRDFQMHKNKKYRIDHYDLLQQIQNNINTLKQKNLEIRFLHVYSHQDKANDERKAKIEKERIAINDNNLYSRMIHGNEICDYLATEALQHKDINRNWIDTPTLGVMSIYAVHKNHLLSQAPHKFFKKQTQETIIHERKNNDKKSTQARAKYIQILDKTDKKRSFALTSKMNKPNYHHTYITLFKIRTHSIKTLAKLSRLQRSHETNSPFYKYYQQMYPSNNCHFCKKRIELQGMNIVDDTEHFHQCKHQLSKNEIATELWNKIYQLITRYQVKQTNQQILHSSHLLYPWVLPSEGALMTHQAETAKAEEVWGSSSFSSLREVVLFGQEEASVGLIPSALVGSLKELQVGQAEHVADEVSLLVQQALAKAYYRRVRDIAVERDQKKLFRQHVLGLEQSVLH